MNSLTVRLLSSIVAVVVVAGGLFAPVSYAAEKKLSLRERLAISKAIDTYAKSDRSKSACWRFSKAKSLENGVRTAVATAKKTSLNKKTCPSVKAIQAQGKNRVNVQFSPGTGWQVIDQTVKVTKPFPESPTALIPLGSRLIPFGEDIYRDSLDIYGPYRGQLKAQYGSANTNAQGDISLESNGISYTKWFAAYSIPPTCASATASFSTRIQRHSGFRSGELSGYIKALSANGQNLGSIDLPTVPLANQPAEGPSGSLTIPIDPVTGAIVVFETNLADSGSTLPPQMVKTLSVSGNCSLSIQNNRITLTSATDNGESIRVNGRIEAQYSDGEWRAAPQGDIAAIGRTLFPIGTNGEFSVEVRRGLFPNFSESVTYRGNASRPVTCRNDQCRF